MKANPNSLLLYKSEAKPQRPESQEATSAPHAPRLQLQGLTSPSRRRRRRIHGEGQVQAQAHGGAHLSTPEEIAAGSSAGRPTTFKKHEEKDVYNRRGEPEEEDDSEDFARPKHKGTEGLIEIENPNLVKPKNIKAKDIDIGKATDISRREREELEKQMSHERHMKLQEQGKTEQARKDLEHLTLIRQQRAEAAKKREEEKSAKEERKAEARNGPGKV